MLNYTKQLERGAEILTGNVSPRTRARMKARAEEISRVGDLAAHAATVEAALMKAIQIVYEADTDGLPANFDLHTGQIWIALPWTKTGWKLYGLRDWESDLLRWILLRRLTNGAIESLFDYNQSARRWVLRSDIYPSKERALAWLKADPVTVHEWRAALEIYQKRRARYRTG